MTMMNYKHCPSAIAATPAMRAHVTARNFLIGQSDRLTRSSPERVRFYLESLLADQDPAPAEGVIPVVLDRFDSLMSISAGGKPFIYTNGHSASLHFDVLSVHSEMDVKAPCRLVLGYTQSMMGFLLFHQNPRTIAMIGLGGGSMPKYCHRYLPDASIVVLENNASVIALRDHFHIPPDDERLSIQLGDGADFVKRACQKYDVLVVDGFNRTGQPAQLCSQAFYDDCYEMLADDGIMVVNLIDNDYVSHLYIERMRRSFDGAVITIPAIDSLNKIVFSCKGASLHTPNQVLIKRLKKIAAAHTVDLCQVLQTILRQRRLESVMRVA
jgi:spermidine synthase